MSAQVRSIKIAFNVSFGERKNKVVSVKNSTEFDPGQLLTDAQVDALCRDSRWDVTRVPLQHQQQETKS